tara:strand:- start:249 stop:443 length:195 start_codon:yes stop_codon:yes gene_type:complete
VKRRSSTGESWLALAEYTAVFQQDADTAEIRNQIDDYMIDRYGGKTDKYFYTWGTMGAERTRSG